MRFIPFLLIPLLLTGCLNESKISQNQCYEIYTSPDLQPIKLDKCTGETWILVKNNFTDQGKDLNKFAHRWAPILTDHEEAILSYPWKK